MEDEINRLREKFDNFVEWAKRREESNLKKLSYLNESFDILLKLFVSKNGAVQLRDLNLQRSPNTNEVVNGFSDEEDREESPKIISRSQKSSLRANQVNKQTQTVGYAQTRKSIINGELQNSVKDENIENSVMIKSVSIGGRYIQPVKFRGKKYRENLEELKKRHDDVCIKYPNCLKIPDSYLEYGAARGWGMRQIRFKFNKNRRSVRRKQRIQTLNIIQNACLKEEDIEKHIIAANSSPVLDLTPEEYQANLKALQDAHIKCSRTKVLIPDFYFQFGAARGWNLKQVTQKFYHTTSKERLKKLRAARKKRHEKC